MKPKDVYVFVNLFVLFAALIIQTVHDVSPTETVTSHTNANSPSPNDDEAPSVLHASARAAVSDRQIKRPLNIVESTDHTSSLHSSLHRQQIHLDQTEKERRLALRRKSAKKLYDNMPSEIKKARIRSISERQKARLKNMTEQEKQEFNNKQNEAKRKHLRNPNTRKYEKSNNIKHSGEETLNAKKVSAIPDLNELPPKEPERKRKQSVGSNADETGSSKRRKTTSFYSRMTSDEKMARSQQVAMTHKARFESWTEKQKEEFRAKKREAKKKHLARSTTRDYQKRKQKHYILSNQEEAQPREQASVLLDLNEPPPIEHVSIQTFSKD